jgi:phosphate-selective porin OprO/OprP
MKPLLLFCLALSPLAVSAQDSEAAPEQNPVKKPKAEKHTGFTIAKDRPTIRLGSFAEIGFRIKVQNDFKGFDPQLTTVEGCGPFADSAGCTYELHRARVGVKGEFLKHFEFEVEREFADVDETVVRLGPNDTEIAEELHDVWRDVYVDFRRFRQFSLQGGKFKVPFGANTLLGDTDLDFIQRSRIASLLTPGRDIGIMAHGRFFKRGLTYQAGLFRHDGDNAQIAGFTGTGQGTWAGRLTGKPLRLLPLPKALREVEFGANVTTSYVPEGLKGLRGRTVQRETFHRRLFVKGRRTRSGVDLGWTPGPFALRAEFINVNDERHGQSITGANLPDAIYRGWYLSGSWLLTGENKEDLKPRRPFRAYLVSKGIGAVEIAARYEQIRFGSSEHPGNPSRSLRAANVLANSNRVWTLGVTWYLNTWVKIQGNFIREKLEDPQRFPIPGVSTYWSQVVRLQFVM